MYRFYYGVCVRFFLISPSQLRTYGAIKLTFFFFVFIILGLCDLKKKKKNQLV